mmetsp:Transcript_117311/g.278585  ORF Transcript_117311/g.278585 Transcript_117311/m.278585 type:complete len:234 (+) Transcript_117311:155-856(+)
MSQTSASSASSTKPRPLLSKTTRKHSRSMRLGSTMMARQPKRATRAALTKPPKMATAGSRPRSRAARTAASSAGNIAAPSAHGFLVQSWRPTRFANSTGANNSESCVPNRRREDAVVSLQPDKDARTEAASPLRCSSQTSPHVTDAKQGRNKSALNKFLSRAFANSNLAISNNSMAFCFKQLSNSHKLVNPPMAHQVCTSTSSAVFKRRSDAKIRKKPWVASVPESLVNAVVS